MFIPVVIYDPPAGSTFPYLVVTFREDGALHANAAHSLR